MNVGHACLLNGGYRNQTSATLKVMFRLDQSPNIAESTGPLLACISVSTFQFAN